MAEAYLERLYANAQVSLEDAEADRDRFRDALRDLIEAMDAQRDASVMGEGRAEADAAFARALAAARGVL